MTSRQAAKPKGWREDRYRQLVEVLIQARKHRALSQQQLARLLDRGQPFVSRYETGERRLDVAEFADVAVALGLSPSKLINGIWG